MRATNRTLYIKSVQHIIRSTALAVKSQREFSQSILLKQLNEGFKGVPVLGEIDFLQLQYLLFGLALVIMMLRRPGGLFPERRAARHRPGESKQ